jgi:two-component system sensor histidine kinase KdpD
VPKQAERALEHYFSPGNLTALRELDLDAIIARHPQIVLDRGKSSIILTDDAEQPDD